MPLGKWTRRVNGIDTIWAEDINNIANAVIELEEQAKKQEPVNDNPVFSGKLTVDGIEIYKENDSEGWVVIRRPESISGVAPVPASTLKLGYDCAFIDEHQIYHSGNLKNVTEYGNTLNSEEKAHFMSNTGLNDVIGDIETALDAIIALQESFIGGNA